MSLSMIDLALRAASIALLLVLAASLLRDVRQSVAGRLAIAFALGSAAHAATAGIDTALPVSAWHAPVIALSTGNVVVFWLFACALFDDGFRLRRLARAGLACGRGLQLRQLPVDRACRPRAALHRRDQSARARLHRPCDRADRSPPGRPISSKAAGACASSLSRAAALYGGVNAFAQMFAPQGDAAEIADHRQRRDAHLDRGRDFGRDDAGRGRPICFLRQAPQPAPVAASRPPPIRNWSTP